MLRPFDILAMYMIGSNIYKFGSYFTDNKFVKQRYSNYVKTVMSYSKNHNKNIDDVYNSKIIKNVDDISLMIDCFVIDFKFEDIKQIVKNSNIDVLNTLTIHQNMINISNILDDVKNKINNK